MGKKCAIQLSPTERAAQSAVVQDVKAGVRRRRRARILLDVDGGPHGPRLTDQAISDARGVSVSTVARVRQMYAEGGLNLAMSVPPSPLRRDPKLDRAQAHLLRELVAGPLPPSKARWSLPLLRDELAARTH